MIDQQTPKKADNPEQKDELLAEKVAQIKSKEEAHTSRPKVVDRQRATRQRTTNRRRFKRPPKEYEEKIIDIARVTNVVKGGRRFSFSVVVVVGNHKGKVGLGHGKALEVPDAIKKAVKDAQKQIVNVPIIDNRTIPHQQNSKFCASKILIKPAPRGRGIIASGTVRSIVELAGYKDIYTKTYGSRNKQNIAKAVMISLKSLRTAVEIATLRDKAISEII